MRLRAATLALAAACALAAAQPAAAADRCKQPRRADTIAKSTRIHVYRAETRVTGPEGASYACNRRTGRRWLLDRTRDELFLSSGFDFPEGPAPQLAGYHLAYVTVQFEGAEGEYVRLRTLDLATGKKRALGFWEPGAGHFLVGFHIHTSGAIAWHEVADASRVWRAGVEGKQLLDSAPGRGIYDFAVGGTAREPLVYWMNGETPRSAPLR